jgi:hypothetical protein
MSALSSTVVEDQKPGGVRSLEGCPQCGETKNVQRLEQKSPDPDRVWVRCLSCALTRPFWLQSANAVNSQTVNESPAEHQNKEIGKEQSQ